MTRAFAEKVPGSMVYEAFMNSFGSSQLVSCEGGFRVAPVGLAR